jgi:F0F1-type ATP synthase assembly protein I
LTTKDAVPDGNKNLSGVAEAMRTAGPWLSATWQFTGSAMLGVATGWYVDSRFATGPYALAGLGLLGSALGFYAFIRATNRILESQAKEKNK